MSKTKIIATNMFTTAIYQMCTIAFGMIIPHLFLVEYGASIHGLTSTITNILSYVALLNAGLLTASVQALYKPLSNGNNEETNGILNAVRKYYNKVGFYYIITIIIISCILPIMVSKEIDSATVILIMFAMGLTNIFDSFLGAKYRVLVQADQKYWFISICGTVTLVLKGILQIVFIRIHLSVVLVQLLPALMTLLTFIALKIFVNKKYKFLRKDIPPDYKPLSQRKAALIHQIAGVVVNNTDTILLTIFSNLTIVSVYSVYQMVFTHLYSLTTAIFSSSAVASFGHIIAKDNLTETVNAYNKFEKFFYFSIAIILSIASVMIIPFVRIYTKEITDIRYVDLNLALLFMIIAVLNNARVPGGMMINAAGHYKKTQLRAVTEALINIVISVILIKPFGIYGVLIGTICSFLYRTSDIIIYTNRKILKRKSVKSFINLMQVILIVICTYFIMQLTNIQNVDTWLKWIIYSFICLIISFCIATLFYYISDRKNFNANINEIKKYIEEKVLGKK